MEIETVVVGAGFVGLAVGLELASRGAEVLLLEQHCSVGAETSSRNSEVLHVGLYSPKSWLKTKLCLEGKNKLSTFCLENKVPLHHCGKLIVATSEGEIAKLKNLHSQALENGIQDIEWINSKRASELEPQLTCFGALYSPSTALVDSTSLLIALENSFKTNKGVLSLQTKLVNIEVVNNGEFKLIMNYLPSLSTETLKCKNLILATGLHATQTANLLVRHLKCPVPETRFAKGHYYVLKKENPFSHLIYPLPSDAGLGIHFTLSLLGQPKFGPDVEWSRTPSVKFDHTNEKRLLNFVSSIQKYWPVIQEEMLEPGYVGVRPRLYPEGELPADFAIHGPEHHGVSNLVVLYGIESPGLTSCLGIGAYVADILKR
ncbi:MAG: NAD(P)/FAD-dependent oxidoreductase [Hyphomicrobium sp.]